MTKVLHARPHSKATETDRNLRRKKLHRTKGSNFLRDSLERKDNSYILKDGYSSGPDPSIFTSIEPEKILKDQINKLNLSSIETSKPFPASVQNVLLVRFKKSILCVATSR